MLVLKEKAFECTLEGEALMLVGQPNETGFTGTLCQFAGQC